jgi:hypothetical protein
MATWRGLLYPFSGGTGSLAYTWHGKATQPARQACGIVDPAQFEGRR